MNNWNELLLIKRLHKKESVRHAAGLLLNQLNTASNDKIKREVENFVTENKIKK